jgi:hypothetical protein
MGASGAGLPFSVNAHHYPTQNRFAVPLEVLMVKTGQRALQAFPPLRHGMEVNIPMLLAELAEQVKAVDPNQGLGTDVPSFLGIFKGLEYL